MEVHLGDGEDTLGALTVLTGKHYVINSFLVVTGASGLVTSLVVTLRVHRLRIDAVASAAQDFAYGRRVGAVPRGPATTGARA